MVANRRHAPRPCAPRPVQLHEQQVRAGEPGQSLPAYTPIEQLEGDAVDEAAGVEFPSMELAKAGS